jgi:hypothetical protein
MVRHIEFHELLIEFYIFKFQNSFLYQQKNIRFILKDK